MNEHGVIIAGESRGTGDTFEVRNPFDGSLVAIVHNAGPADIEEAIAASVTAFETTRTLASWKRSSVLDTVARRIAERRDELARIVALEAGKPIRTARLEVDRAAFVFTVAAEEARRIEGRIISLDWLPGTDRKDHGIVRSS